MTTIKLKPCPTCHGTGKTPCALDFSGPNDRPARVKYGKCPSCSEGDVCPSCLFGVRLDDDGRVKCGRCGWLAAKDDARASPALTQKKKRG